MAEFLSSEWLAAARGAVANPAVDVRVQVTVTGAPGGDMQWHAICDGGSLAVDTGALADAEVTLTLPYADAVAVQRGELDPIVAYMQGRMKTAGDPGKLLDLLASTATPAYAELRAKLEAITDF
jgi:SCP-2 sterol transfer family